MWPKKTTYLLVCSFTVGQLPQRSYFFLNVNQDETLRKYIYICFLFRVDFRGSNKRILQRFFLTSPNKKSRVIKKSVVGFNYCDSAPGSLLNMWTHCHTLAVHGIPNESRAFVRVVCVVSALSSCHKLQKFQIFK